MPYAEFLGWLEYFRRRPPLHEFDQGISVILRALGAKEKPENIFPRLRLLNEGAKNVKTLVYDNDDGLIRTNSSTFIDLAGFAKGGDKLGDIMNGNKA